MRSRKDALEPTQQDWIFDVVTYNRNAGIIMLNSKVVYSI